MTGNSNAMVRGMSLLARLVTAQALLFGTAMMNTGLAEERAPAPDQSGLAPEHAGDQPHGASGGTSDTVKGSTTDTKVGGKDERKFDDRAGIRRSATDPNPIDTRITVPAMPTRTHDWKRPNIIGPSTDVRGPRRTSTPGTRTGVVRKAIGQPVGIRQASRGPDGRVFTPAAGDGARKATVPAIGPASVSGPDFHRQIFVPVTAIRTDTSDQRVSTAMNHSIINGTGMMRPGSGTSMIGGPAKNVSGVVSGTSFRPKHP